MSNDLTLAVLSWNAHRTLVNTLSSYKTFGIDEVASQRIIWFQEISDEDRRIAAKFGYEAHGSSRNIGIAGAYKNLVELATGKQFLFLENDWVALEGPQAIEEAYQLLEGVWIDVARLRHRRFPGHPLWTLQFKDNEMERPTHLLDCVHWVENPPEKFPLKICRDRWQPNWFTASCEYANWTNNPTMFRTSWLKRNLLPRLGTRDIEIDVQQWWQNPDNQFEVGQGEGIFTHKRIG